MQNLSDEALSQAMPLLQGEYESEICAVCGEEKWPNYPFCRSCSIKLQRAGMMQDLNKSWAWMLHDYGERARAWNFKTEHGQKIYAAVYDRCRDYLMVIRRMPVARKKREDDDTVE